jgi:hypothetical protein
MGATEIHRENSRSHDKLYVRQPEDVYRLRNVIRVMRNIRSFTLGFRVSN